MPKHNKLEHFDHFNASILLANCDLQFKIIFFSCIFTVYWDGIFKKIQQNEEVHKEHSFFPTRFTSSTEITKCIKNKKT